MAQPDAWNCLDEDDKREIISLLPSGVHPDPNPTDKDGTPATISPLPQNYLRYDNHWRGAIRRFKEELGGGFYEPQWQRLAKKAGHERAAGHFDQFKEREFEEFWGQKQR